MSECIICSGDKNKLRTLGFTIKAADDFLRRGAFWLGEIEDDIWTFEYHEKEIDTIITDAQRQMHENIKYESTSIYKVLNMLIDNNICFAMWYDVYMEDLDVCNSKEDVLKTCYKQIMDESGMCEVYIVSNL